jgi:hypothetical protein
MFLCVLLLFLLSLAASLKAWTAKLFVLSYTSPLCVLLTHKNCSISHLALRFTLPISLAKLPQHDLYYITTNSYCPQKGTCAHSYFCWRGVGYYIIQTT